MKSFKRYVFACIFVGVFAALLLQGYEQYHQQRLVNCFKDNHKNQPYSQEVALTEMDFSIYWYSLPGIAPVLNPRITYQVTLPCDVEYYSDINDIDPVMILQKGVEVYYNPIENADFVPYGYGVKGWPDYEKGWRYAYPFVTEGLGKAYQENGMYYVKSEQLEAVARAWHAKDDKRNTRRDGVAEYVRFETQMIDAALYRNGAFCSPSLDWRMIKLSD